MIGDKLQRQAGFSLIEVVVSMAIFGIIAVTVSAVYVNSISLQRKGSGAQAVEESTQYILELMAREIRVGKVLSSNVDCVATFASSLNITNSAGANIVYQLSGGAVQRIENGVTTTVSPTSITFTRLNFCIKGAGVDGQQARVAIIASVQNVTNVAKDQVIFNIETLVANREIASEL